MTFEPAAYPTAQDSAEALARLGPALIDGGAIDQRTLDRARRVAGRNGRRLDRVLIQLGLVSERGLAEAWSQLLGAPLARQQTIPTEPLLRERLRPKFLRQAHAVPLAAGEDRATWRWPTRSIVSRAMR